MLIIVLPYPILKRLQLDKRKKVSHLGPEPLNACSASLTSQVILSALYGLGLFVTIVQALRMRTIANLATYTDSKGIIIWSIVEINLGVFIACVPAFTPLLKVVSRKTAQYRFQTRSRAKKRTAQSAHVESGNPTKDQIARKNESGFGTTIKEEACTPDDEIALWTSRRGWPGDANAWTETNSHPMTNLRAPESSVEDDDGVRIDERDLNDIMVTREIIVRRA